MRKRMLLLLLTAAGTVTLLSGCKKNVGTPEDNAVAEESDETENEEKDGQLFGYSCIDLSNPFYETLGDSIRTSLGEQGDQLMIKDPGADSDTQIAQIQEMIDADVDAVFLCPVDWKEITPALEALDQADIPVINLDTEVQDMDDIDAFVGSDNRNAGYVCGQNLLENKPDGGKIVIVESPSVNSVNERITGFEKAIANKGFEVIERINADDDVSKVYPAMETLLQSGEKIDAVMCGNDQMAEQVLQALSAGGVSEPLVYSVDGSPAIKKALADPNSPMQGVGAQSPISMGKTAVKVADAILDGSDFPKETYEDTFFIGRDDVQMYGTDGWQ